MPAIALCSYAPSADELAYLALANAERSDRGMSPLVWSDDLGRAARAHSEDMTANGCTGHNSCNGELWWKRIQRYYPGWFSLAENVGIGTLPAVHDGWMVSPGHRDNILGSFVEFGAGISISTSGSRTPYVTEDFGQRGTVSIPTLPAGGVAPRIGWARDSRELLVNYFDPSGKAPRAVRALVGSACVNLPLAYGSAANGTYATNRLFPADGCVPVVFEAIGSDGTRHRWPSNKALVVGTGYASLSCADFSPAVPTQDCGGGGGPLPTGTPVPAPTPGAGHALDSLRIVLNPGRADGSMGVVQVQAKLPEIPASEPGSGPLSVHLGYGQSGKWQQAFPELTANGRATAFRARVDGSTVSLVRQNGRFRLRLTARKQTLSGLQPGTVDLTVTVGGRTFVGSAEGEIVRQKLVAD